MEYLPPFLTIIFTIFISVLSNYLFFKYQRFSEFRIKKNLHALDVEEDFLIRISKGNIDLIRTGLSLLSISIGFSCISAALIIIPKIFGIHGHILTYFYAVSGGLLIAVAYSCFYFARSILDLRNLTKAKNSIEKRRQKLRLKSQYYRD